MKWASKNNQNKGFTIVELLIVVVVIAILAAITIVSYNGIQSRAQQSRYNQTAQTILKKIEIYKTSTGAYPVFADVTLTDLYTGVSGAPKEVQLTSNLQIFYTSNIATYSYADVKDAADGKYSGIPQQTYIAYICSTNNGYMLLVPNLSNKTVTTQTVGSC